MYKKAILTIIISATFILGMPNNALALCQSDEDCGLDQVCQLQFGSGTCVARENCDVDSDCSGGKTCQFFSVNQKVCLPPAQGSQSASDTGCVPGPGGREICKLTNPIGSGQQGTTEVSQIVGTGIRVLLGIIGGLTLLMFVYGGFMWLTSAGSPEKVKSGTQTMVWAVIGVMLVLASYLLLSTFLDFLTGKAT